MQSTRRILFIFTILSVFFSALAFASDSSTPEQAPLEVETQYNVDQDLLVYREMAVSLAAANPQYTIDDIYSLLTTTNSTLSTISSRVNTTNTRLTTTNSKLDTLLYGVLGTNTGTPALDILSTLYLSDGAGGQYTLSELVGMCWSRLGNIDSQLDSLYTISNQAQSLITETQRTNSKLEYVFSAVEDTINIKWYDSGVTYLGTSLSLGGQYIYSQESAPTFFVDYSVSSDFVNPQLFRFSLPLLRTPPNYTHDYSYSLVSITATNSNNTISVTVPDYFIQQYNSGIYLYLFDPPLRSGYTYTFEITLLNNASFTYRPTYSSSVVTIPFDTLDFQIIKTAFYQAKDSRTSVQQLDQLISIGSQLSSLAQSSSSGAAAAEALADYFVSPQKQAAEDASQQVINETLNDFTGSGSGAAKKSDSKAMSDVSGSIQSGLNSGGSVSGATGVFNSGSDFWGWFSQDNANKINNPYPAPVVNNTRKSSGSGDEIVDFLTPNSQTLQDLLRNGDR